MIHNKEILHNYLDIAMCLLIQAQNEVDMSEELYQDIEELLDVLDLEFEYADNENGLPAFVKQELLKMKIKTDDDGKKF